jgi:hypothetical protein
MLSGCRFGYDGYGEWGVRRSLYIFSHSLIDLDSLKLVLLLVLFSIGGFWFFDLIDGGVVFFDMWSRFSSQVSDFVVGASSLYLGCIFVGV